MRKQITIEDSRSFTLEQFERIKKTNELKELVNFHTINKYLLMMHSQNELKILGNLVANLNQKPVSIIFQEYEEQLKQTLNIEVTLSATANVLNRIYSHFRKNFTPKEKKLFLKTIEDFKDGKISLGEVLNHVDGFIEKYENDYLKRQTFYLLFSDIVDENSIN